MSQPHRHEDPATPIPSEGAADGQHEHSAQAIEISANHRRGISSTLTYLDEAICRAEQMINSDGTQSVLFREHNALTESQKKAVLAEIAALRLLLAELRETLDLRPVTRDVAAAVSGSCMMLWESIIELQGRYLKRYGVPPEELVSYLDPKTGEIIERLDRIVRILGVFRRSGPSTAGSG